MYVCLNINYIANAVYLEETCLAKNDLSNYLAVTLTLLVMEYLQCMMKIESK